MRLVDISIRSAPPVTRFSAEGLSDLIVIAGPNGAGKSRLLLHLINHLRGNEMGATIEGSIAATSQTEKDLWGGLERLDLADRSHLQLFRQGIQANRRRHYLKSSLVVFESDRSIQNMPALQPSWENPDPYEEEVSWDATFNPMRDRYRDTVHSMFRLMTAQGQGIANRARELQRSGKKEMRLEFSDPMESFKRVFSQLLAPKELVDPVPSRGDLQYRQDGEVREFSTLSSGEWEVVKTSFDFLLRNPEDCMVFFDEPELHLHPELSYRLIQTLQTIGSRNQLFLSTHSPDIISASLDQTVLFLTAPGETAAGEPVNQAIRVTEADETHQALRLIGQSIGIVSLGRKIVLIEGDHSSLDKQVYGSIAQNRYPSLVLVPSGGRHLIQTFEAIYSSVLSKTIWGVEFFMLCDADSSPIGAKTGVANSSGRLRTLSRYHLENFFLEEHVWASAFRDIEPTGHWLRDPVQIRSKFRNLARQLVSYSVALSVSSKVRLTVGNADLMPKDATGKTEAQLAAQLKKRAKSESTRLGVALDGDDLERQVTDHYRRLVEAIDTDSADWKVRIPGRPLLGMFAAAADLPIGRAKAMYMAANARGNFGAFGEVEAILLSFHEP